MEWKCVQYIQDFIYKMKHGINANIHGLYIYMKNHVYIYINAMFGELVCGGKAM